MLRSFSLSLLALACAARADVVYSGLQSVGIPTNFDGIYVDIDTGTTSTTEFTGWDINPFFGGVGVANSPAFQPVRIGTGYADAILRLNVGATIDASRLFSSGYGGSDSHLGPAGTQFQPGQEAYLGFKLTTNAGAGPYYGWARVVFTANTPGGVIQDWAYDNSIGSISAGNIVQTLVATGQKLTTLRGAAAEHSTLASSIADGGGNVTSVNKTGAGTWTLKGDQSYSGSTTVDGGTLEVAEGGKLSQTQALKLNAGTLLLSGNGGLNAKLKTTALVTLNGGQLSLAGLLTGLDQQLGTLTLSATSTLDLGSAGHTLRFDDSSSSLWTAGQLVNVYDWTAGSDHLYVGTDLSGLTTSQLAQVRFYSDAGGHFLGSGGFSQNGELTPIPEPAAWLAAGLLLGAAGWREWRRRS